MPESTLDTQLVLTHPYASSQPTAVGRAIRTIAEFDGKLFSGYGDWGANTGPIQITAYDPSTGMLSDEYLMGTQQIARFVKVGARLYLAGIDGSDEVAFRESGSSTWTAFSNLGFGWPTDPNQVPGFLHCFDIATLDGTDVWLFGATNPDDGIVAHSPDGGFTWNLQGDPHSLDLVGTSQSAGFNRLYFGAVYQGKLYTQSPYYSKSRIFDPAIGSWAAGPDILKNGSLQKYTPSTLGSLPLEFNGELLFCAGYPGISGRLYSFDGRTRNEPLQNISTIYSGISDMQVYGNYLYMLAIGAHCGIIRTTDLVHWESGGIVTHSGPGDEPTCFRILDDIIYIGNKASEIRSTVLPAFVPIN